MQPGGIVPFSAANVQNFARCTIIQCGLIQSIGNGLIKPSLQKGAAGEYLLPGIAGGKGMLLLDGQQIHISLTGNIKAVPVLAEKCAFRARQNGTAYRT